MATKRIGVVFPGYGQQFIGMGKDLYDELRIVQEYFEQASGVVDINFVKLLFASSDQEILSIRYGYLGVYVLQTAIYNVLHQKGLKPDFVAGYGIGEYSACYASGSLSFVDGLYILNKYASFYDEFVKSKPYTVLRIVKDFDLENLEKLCALLSSDLQAAYVSAYNTKHAFYVAGDKHVIEQIQDFCLKHVIRKVRVIGPEYGMHSHLEDDIVAQLKLYYHKIKFSPLQVPLITNVDGVYVTTPDALESAMMRKINNRIQWYEVIQGFEGCDVIISVGPGDQLIEWFLEVYPDKQYHSIIKLSDLDILEKILHEQPVEESEMIESQSADDIQKIPHDDIDGMSKVKDLYEADLVNERASDFDIEDEE